jgi:hypothetical protein
MLTALGSILTIVIIGVIYYLFTNFDAKQADKYVDRHVKQTMADVELEKLKAQQEETRLKREFFEFQKAQVLEDKSAKPINASYKVKNELEDKAKKTPQSQ